MWNVKSEVILVIKGATGIISESLRQKLQHQVTTANNHTGHCTHTAASANVKVQNITCTDILIVNFNILYV
jgi:6-phosphofructokinase